MKHNLLYAFAILILASCATTKTTSTVTTTPAAKPASTAPAAAVVSTVILGDWDYTITGTPDGDFKGVLTISSAANVYVAKMVSATGEVPVEKFAFAKETNKITGEIPYNGMSIGLDATMTGEELRGTMFAGGMDFPFNATRKK
jgi:hypothetical protein